MQILKSITLLVVFQQLLLVGCTKKTEMKINGWALKAPEGWEIIESVGDRVAVSPDVPKYKAGEENAIILSSKILEWPHESLSKAAEVLKSNGKFSEVKVVSLNGRDWLISKLKTPAVFSAYTSLGGHEYMSVATGKLVTEEQLLSFLRGLKYDNH